MVWEGVGSQLLCTWITFKKEKLTQVIFCSFSEPTLVLLIVSKSSEEVVCATAQAYQNPGAKPTYLD